MALLRASTCDQSRDSLQRAPKGRKRKTAVVAKVPCTMPSFCRHCVSLLVEGTRSAGSFRENGNVIDLNLQGMWKRIYRPSPAAQQPFAKQVLTFCAQLVVYMYRHRPTHTQPMHARTHAHTHTHTLCCGNSRARHEKEFVLTCHMSEPESCIVFCDPKETLLFGKVFISTNASPSKTVLDLESFSFVCGDSCLCPPSGCRRGWQQCLSPSMNGGDLLQVALAKVVQQHPEARYHEGLVQSSAAVHVL